MKHAVSRAVKKALLSLLEENGWERPQKRLLEITIPKNEKFGDYSTNIAMLMAPLYKTAPAKIAGRLSELIGESDLFSATSVAGPGFINMTVDPEYWATSLNQVLTAGGNFGKIEQKEPKEIILEFVSANPTGPLHIGHGRGAVVGDSLARILRFAGHDVHTEYYVNDAGLQMNNLGQSTLERCKELLGKPFDEPAYKGDYIREIARNYLDEKGEDIIDGPPEPALAAAREFSARAILDGIRSDLDNFRVHFDNWFSEESLHSSGAVEGVLDRLEGDGHIYEKEGAKWLKTESAGDEKDRVARRANGVVTYLAADMAYHENKINRGFTNLVNVWGADHHGYVPRMRAVIKALGRDPDMLDVILVQFVSLKKGDEIISMSTREGVFTTLREIVDEVGVDAARFFFMMRSADSKLVFDIDLALKHSSDNPVYYVQYAHARCCNIFVTAAQEGVELVDFKDVDIALLQGVDEMRLIKKLLHFPDMVEACADSLAPHPITSYLTELAALFHYFYKHNRVITENVALSQARLTLVKGTMKVLENGLGLLGISAPERM